MEILDRIKTSGFKLIKLTLVDNPIMGKGEVTYDFVDPEDDFKSIYTTVVIGPNGTGKSNLFRIIIDLFKYLHDLKTDMWKFKPIEGAFSLVYTMGGNVYEFTDIKGVDGTGIRSLINGRSDSLVDPEIPVSIVANSIMLTDKFPNYSKIENPDLNNPLERIEAFPAYKYLGLRNTPQGASTRSYVRRTVELVAKEGSSIEFKNGLYKAIEYLGLRKRLTIYYNTSNASIFFSGKLSPSIFNDYFEDIRKRYEGSTTNPPFKLGLYLKISQNPKLIEKICSFCNELRLSDRVPKIHSSGTTRRLSYDILNEDSHLKLTEEYELVDLIRQLGIFYAPEIQLHRESDYHLQDSSSGEYHFFASIVGLMATVKTNSLVFIDEPEVSLHPNWQMKYLSFLRMLFENENYASSHIIVATHSHFLISDLDGHDSKIIGLTRKDGKVEIADIPKSLNTYGWSAEEVLYSVFDVRTSRNSYFEYDLYELVALINNGSKDFKRIGQILKKISTIVLSKADPLNIIIEKAKKYLLNR